VTSVGNLEGASSGDLRKGGGILLTVGNEVAVEVVGEVSLGDLVTHGDGMGNAFYDGLGDYRYDKGV
jgi:hypothetical protein